jgi:hypothetical protein
MLKVYEENEEMQKERTYLDQTNIQRHKKMQELHKISAEQKSLNSLFASICLFLISTSLSFNLVPFSFNDATVSGSTVPPSSIILLFLGAK